MAELIMDSMGVLLLFLILLVSVSKSVRYYCKWIFFGIWNTLGATLPVPLMLLRPCDWRNALLPAKLCRTLSWLFGIKWEVSGQENLVPTGAVVLLNHQSFLDIQCLAEIWPVIDRCAVISKREIFYLWPFGLAAWLWGTIFIDRLNPEKAQNAVNSTGRTVRNKGTRLLMFPEGTRHGGSKLLPFKKGAFHVAIESQTAVQPVVVSQYHFLHTPSKTFNGGTVLIRILPAISTVGLTKADLPSLIDKTYKVMSEEYTRICQEARARDSVAEHKKIG